MSFEYGKDEDFSFFEKLVIVLLWLMMEVSYCIKREWLLRKYRSRKVYIIIGVLLYTMIILLANLL
jgi:hypothetical protein